MTNRPTHLSIYVHVLCVDMHPSSWVLPQCLQAWPHHVDTRLSIFWVPYNHLFLLNHLSKIKCIVSYWILLICIIFTLHFQVFICLLITGILLGMLLGHEECDHIEALTWTLDMVKVTWPPLLALVSPHNSFPSEAFELSMEAHHMIFECTCWMRFSGSWGREFFQTTGTERCYQKIHSCNLHAISFI